jgi:hypothetical protein
MRKVLLGASLLVFSATAAFAQGQPQGSAPGRSQGDVPPYTAEIGPRQGDWEGFIGGTGASNGEFNDNALGVTGSLGYYVLKWLPVSLRQSYVTRFGGRVNDRNDFATTVGVDFQAPLGRWQPFVGGAVGYSYGDQNSGLAGPEAGIKVYVNESTFIEGRMVYGWLFDKTLDWDNGRAAYTIGMGFNF